MKEGVVPWLMAEPGRLLRLFLPGAMTSVGAMRVKVKEEKRATPPPTCRALT